MAGLRLRLWPWPQSKDASRAVDVPRALASSAPVRYSPSSPGNELRQGEIISGLLHFVAVPDGSGATDVTETLIPYAVIATPDCDLLQAFNDARTGKREKINGILFFEAEEAPVAKARIGYGRKEWDMVCKNHVEGFHLLDGFRPDDDHAGQQIPNLIVDFKRYFMLPTREVYRQCGLTTDPRAIRRCCLGDQWRAEFGRRSWNYMSRLGTPG